MRCSTGRRTSSSASRREFCPSPTHTSRPAGSTRSSASGSRAGWRGARFPRGGDSGGLDWKFGFGLEDGLAARAIAEVRGSRNLSLVGLHAHIGSQIFELEPYAAAIEALPELADGDWECRILNVGGGLGIADTSADRPPS